MGGNGLLGKILTILEIEENMKIHKTIEIIQIFKSTVFSFCDPTIFQEIMSAF